MRLDSQALRRRLAAYGARLLERADPGYPPGLLDLHPAPPFLCVLGELPAGGVAIIGSRRPPAGAAEFAFELARRVRGPVVSGLALGIDAAVHRGALEAGTPTIAYVGYGFGRTYPQEHRALERQIVRAGGGVATERFPEQAVARNALVARDRLQAAHARATVLIESEIDGGAMHTMRFARELGRLRFALEPPRGAQGGPAWGGNVRALADGAQPLPYDVDEAVSIIHAATN